MDKTLDKLLARLPTRSDEQTGSQTLVGRALSRSEENLHLATSKGVLAIPIGRIQSVTTRFTEDPALVTVVVKGSESLRLLRRPLRPRRAVAEDGPVVIIGPGVTTTVCTTTYTGEGDETTCDDEDCHSSDDDEPS